MDIYKQIALDIKSDIYNKKYTSSKKLPSIRSLCSEYSCSKSTAIKAYESLINEHLIYSIPQSGYYVVEEHLNNLSYPNIIDFSNGNLNMGRILTPDLKHCLDRAVDIYGNQPVDFHLMGIDSLKSLLPNYLSNFQVFAPKENIFINLGIQQILSLLTNMPFPNGKTKVLLENPTYKYFLDFLKYSKIDFISIDRTPSGIDLNELENLFKNEDIKFFYTTPRNHNPLGTKYSKSQRKGIAELAIKYDVYIVEDDYFGDIEFDSKFDPIYAYGDHSHFIYLKSFTKIIPWIKIGLAVIPAELIDEFNKQASYSYYYSYFVPSLISQATLEIYLKSNILSKHVKLIKKQQKSRLKAFSDELKNLTNPKVKVSSLDTSLYSYIYLPDGVSESSLVYSLKTKGVLVSPGYNYFSSNLNYKKGLRVSIARTDEKQIREGMKILIDELNKV
ncbi:PLP-dependent aminotransferase family protein [Clostridium intestinale]|uniref:PLP-dependent aminotransferase family protein n=1 Tax=Clostridium intestinale TaxID=36845 RepID=A0A7D7A1S6_9CLOT|nr:PLP-dependent aminotransferase family protein [Clostridium intestinale]QLY78718.1 PLP-dependent aminotransferase family protein [Clostridium intestinale]